MLERVLEQVSLAGAALRHALLLGIAGAVLWSLGQQLAQAPALDLVLTLGPQRVVLSQGEETLLDAPRPAAQRLCLRFYQDGIRFQTGEQQLRSLQRLSPAPAVLVPERLEDGALLLDRPVAGTAVYRLQIGSPEDLDLSLLDAADNGISLVLRPLGAEKGWCPRVGGRYGLFQAFGPLGSLRAWTARAWAAEAASWCGAALLVAALFLAVALLLEQAPPSPVLKLPRPRASWALLLGFAAAAASLYWGGAGLAHVTDEISALFQARVFALGRWSMPLPPVPEAFSMEHFVADAAGWRSKYPPFWSALLAPFAARGWEALAGPFYAVTALALLMGWAREAVGRAEALALGIITALSPQFVWMAGSYFNHAPSLAAALLYAWGLWRARERGRAAGWAMAAAGGFALAAMRPFSAACLGLAGGLWALADGGWRRFAIWRGLALSAAGMALAIGASNALAGGSPFSSPYTRYDPMDRPGFGPGLGSLPTWGSFGHSPLKALASLVQDLRDLRWRLLGWPLGLSGGLLLLALLRLRWRRLELLLLALWSSLILGHLLYWAAILLNLGTCYWYEGLPLALWLCLRGAADRSAGWQARGLPLARRAMALLLCVGTLYGCAWLLPRQAWSLNGFAKVDPVLAQTAAPLGPALRGLVFVPVVEPFDYNGPFGLNTPTLDGRLIFVRSRGPALDAALAAAFPGRRPLLLSGRLLLPYRALGAGDGKAQRPGGGRNPA